MTFRSSHLYGNRPEPTVQGAFNADLPLTVVAHIISFLDDEVASLARLCRTSRVLWYMTLPHLWKNVTLRSYNTIRYKGDVPEGFGSASPFSMGLNALVTRNVSNLVRSLSLEGEFGAADLQEHARAGRVSESVMILNIVVRAALDQSTHLENFRWDLDIRIQPNVYAGLAKLCGLESLWIRFPRNRSPQPAHEVPALPNLTSLTFTHYDPLCFPDDVSTLIFHAAKLKTLNMHFSPRMREQGEPSVVLTHFFRKNIAAKRKLRLKKLGIYNLLNGADPSECVEVVDTSEYADITALNIFGPDEDAPLTNSVVDAAHFIDRAWNMVAKPEDHAPKPKSLRLDQLHTRHAQELRKFAGLERLYLVNARYKPKRANGVAANGNADGSPDSASTVPAELSPYCRIAIDDTRSSRNTPIRTASTLTAASVTLRDLYFDNICNVCGPTLKHLILPARWPMNTSLTARLIRCCPKLTQLAAAIECLEAGQPEVLRLLVPFLADLWAIRILAPGDQDVSGDDDIQGKDGNNRFFDLADCVHEEKMATTLAEQSGSPDGKGMDFAKLKYIGLGRRVWEIGAVEEVCAESIDEDEREQKPKRRATFRRKVKRIEEKDVQHVEIWKMDSLDIV
jgi:hypothetical protein